MDEQSTPEAVPIVQGQAVIGSPPSELTASPEADIARTATANDDRVLRIIEEIKSQNEDQISFQRSTHDLIVDLSNRIKQITDDASARAQRAILVELVMLHDSLEQALAWIRSSDPVQPKDAIHDRLETIQIELMEILMRREVRPYDGDHHVLDRRCIELSEPCRHLIQA